VSKNENKEIFLKGENIMLEQEFDKEIKCLLEEFLEIKDYDLFISELKKLLKRRKR
jgi:hypothetical protein